MVAPYYQRDGVSLYLGDCREVMAGLPAESVDFVLTDPPYPREFDACWDALADEAPRVMKPAAALFTLCGHYQLPRVLSSLSRGLNFWWLFIQRNDSSPMLHGYRLRATFKPMPAFVKGANVPWMDKDRPGYMADDLHVAGSVAAAKALHEWGQSVVAEPILRYCPEGGTLLDPFAGSATNLVAAEQEGRKAIGIEIDEARAEIAAKRLAQGVLPFTGGQA